VNRKAFTLIELLVVIAIIAILAAILFPVFARARAKAQQANCMSNLKQIALAIRMYASDYEDVTPHFTPYCGLGGANGYNWWDQRGLLGPYLQSEQVCFCPSAERPSQGGTWTNHGYILQNWYYNRPWADGYWVASKLSDIGNIAMQVAVADGLTGVNGFIGGWPNYESYSAPVCNNLIGGPGGSAPLPAQYNVGLTNDPPYWPAMSTTYPQRWCFSGRHNGQCNMAFLDGHVKAMLLTEISSRIADGKFVYFNKLHHGN
jgi:prepilin-type N-terminal cleavage/methylation domain-containing protein/prepilin-type processing-associated H-X9-DG protein